MPEVADSTESGTARAFTNRANKGARFDHDAGKWFVWREDRWHIDSTAAVLEQIRSIAEETSIELTDARRAAMRRDAFIRGAERIARADPEHAVTQDGWDGDPWLLGCPGGAVDLRTGEIKPPRKADGVTRHAAVAPSRMDCPTWRKFLEEATGGDAAVVEFLRRWCGYCLTGDTREHALIFLYGPGGNGKSVFLNTLSGILGDYCATAAMDTFTAGRGHQHPTDLAMLKGARLVTASETEEGRAWAEARIKQMTGGDLITARFMRQDFFTFYPQFKLTIVGNHAPALANVDDAARRRFNIVPFTVKPPKPDKSLQQKLNDEWPEILGWMLEGCLAWQRDGLRQPASVLDATTEYFGQQDLTAQWLGDSCTMELQNDHRFETSADLFASWTVWARAQGEEPGTTRSLAPRLRRQGLRQTSRKIAGKTYRGWIGVSISKTLNSWDKDDAL